MDEGADRDGVALTDGFGPAAPVRRGACPSLAAPMMTGDGLLVRMRPLHAGLAPDQWLRLCDAAARHGNGIIEVTARGNLQVRGLTPDSVTSLAAEIDDAQIVLAEGLAIETSPLAGLDPTALADPRPVVEVLRAAIAGQSPPLRLAPKLSVIIDGGGLLPLDAVTADIRVRAVVSADGPVRWLLALAGTQADARPVGVLSESAVVPALMALLRALSGMGPAARGRDLDPAALPATGAADTTITVARPDAPAASLVGMHALGPAVGVLGVGLSFCQTDAASLSAFVDTCRILGATDIRPAPGHALLVCGLAPAAIAPARAAAQAAGFRTDPDAPDRHIAVCAGQGACRSGLIDTKAAARMVIAHAPSLLDGSMTVHVSGCPKGCAHPRAAGLTLAGGQNGTGLVVNGLASDAAALYIVEKTMQSALTRLDARVRSGKHAGESARSCLTRLGADTIAPAVGQG